MKTKTKRLQAIFLAMAMSVGVLQASAFAAHEVTPWVAGHENHKLVVDEDSVEFDAQGNVKYDLVCMTCAEGDHPVVVYDGVDKATATTKAATCTTPATTTYSINILGQEFKDSFTGSKPLGHDYQYTIVWPTEKEKPYVTDMTCRDQNELGVTVKAVCSRCGRVRTFTEGWHDGYELTVNEDYSKRVNNVGCKAGSVTFQAAFAITDVDPSAFIYKTVAVNDTKAYPYYKSYVAHKSGVPQMENEDREHGYYDLVTRCTECNEILKSTKISTGEPAHKHTAGTAEKENYIAATYAAPGSYDLTTRCTDCGQVMDRVHKTIAQRSVKASKINSVKNYKGKKAKITVKKAASVTGYQIQYGTKKNFKGAKHVNTRKTSKYLTKLAKNKKYYVRVRTYKTVDGKLYFSSWSGAKTVTIKK